jgi:hypothetical protein
MRMPEARWRRNRFLDMFGLAAGIATAVAATVIAVGIVRPIEEHECCMVAVSYQDLLEECRDIVEDDEEIIATHRQTIEVLLQATDELCKAGALQFEQE